MSEIISEKSKSSTPPQNLEDLLYQFFKLYDNWSLEQKMVGKREAELIKSIEAFDEKVEALDEVKEVINQSIQHEAKTALGVIANTAGAEVLKYCKKGLDHLIQELYNSLSYANRIIPDIQEIERNYSLRLWAIVVLVSLLIGFVAGAAVVSHSTVSIDELNQRVRLK